MEKSEFQKEGFTKNQYIGGGLPKKGAWIVCRFNGVRGKKVGVGPSKTCERQPLKNLNWYGLLQADKFCREAGKAVFIIFS